MPLPYSDELNIERFGHLFEKKSESYKLFWFKAIMSKICSGYQEMTFDELINDMIADAWYMVTEYHLNLGPSDNLEEIVKQIRRIKGFTPISKREDILLYLRDCADKEINGLKNILTKNVPYRLQAPLLTDFNADSWKATPNALANKIDQSEGLIYYFEELNGLNTKIRIDDNWRLYLLKNQEIIRGWIDYNLIIYLQRRNPSVPGISDKLYPPAARNLDKVKNYWKCIVDIKGGLHDIYQDAVVDNHNISIDHFVPWSFVAHDELWNLCPTTKSINSSKSNNLPDWDKHFAKLAKIEYEAYMITANNYQAKTAFEECTKKHVNNQDVMRKLYRQDCSIDEFANCLEEILHPVYESAKNCGFSEWICA